MVGEREESGARVERENHGLGLVRSEMGMDGEYSN
jgi:hypothetical protein